LLEHLVVDDLALVCSVGVVVKFIGVFEQILKFCDILDVQDFVRLAEPLFA
jgi:hypothetical protein